MPGQPNQKKRGFKMKAQEKITFYIGLKTKDMKKKLRKRLVIKKVNENFSNYGILGYNISNISGYWTGKKEKTLKVSFINTFNISYNQIKSIVWNLNTELKQECILVEKTAVKYEFI